MNAAQRGGVIDDAGIMAAVIGEALAERYSDLVHEPLPQLLTDLLRALDAVEAARGKGTPRHYHLVCDHCGSRAEVTLECIDPTTLDLRCMECARGQISVTRSPA